jgi:catechol 2,3-dioxygenase-like lactoylglutathione lyase family enzyme
VPAHINLAVSDVQRSVAFYGRWLGFGPEDRRFLDGTVFIRDAEGTDLVFQTSTARMEPTSANPDGYLVEVYWEP